MYSLPEISISVAGIRLEWPVGNASGVLGWEPAEARLVEESGGGFFVAKSVTYRPRKGYPQPRLYPASGGIVNAVGLANPGFREAAQLLAEAVKRVSIPVIASIAAGGPEEWVEIASTLEDSGVAAVELNLSCPHFEGGGLELGQDPAAVARVVSSVASTLRIPVIAKLGFSDKLVEAASKALGSGARGLTLINSVRAMKIDIYSKKPVLGNRVGGLSGRPIHPIAVRAVYEVYRETGADIFAAGGVEGWEEAVEFHLAGAKAVQVGSAIVARGPQVLRRIVDGVRRYLWIEGFRSLEEIVGYAHRY
ncbi:dihydroorotate dehydrogenase [Aeropyrum camini]|uniref:dihydroorotate dehydrogenase n=1 Tax=Aeropyrum camini TaxID=229980 RepID=UPI000AACF3DF|nr:dihydroorotate dehydrogenase [Aeropyrum camini]